jgi:hypothetical protein
MFGLHSTKDLPKLRELDELFQHKAAELAGGLDISVKTTSGELLSKIQSMVDNEQKIIEHECMKEEGRHEDEIPLPGTVNVAEETVETGSEEPSADSDAAHDSTADVATEAQEEGQEESREETHEAAHEQTHEDDGLDAHDDADHLDGGGTDTAQEDADTERAE